MANIYVRSSDGSNSDNGSTWALAKATLAGAAAIDAAGDSVYLSSAHSESTASSVNAGFSSSGAYVRLLSVNDAAEPPTALSAGALIATTGNSQILLNGSIYVNGMTFRSGVSASGTASQTFSGFGGSVFEDCNFEIGSTGTSTIISAGFSGAVRWINCNVKFGATAQSITPGNLHWAGGGLNSGGSSPTSLFSNVCAGLIEGVDFSNLSSSSNLCSGSFSPPPAVMVFRNCKLPASWSGQLVATKTSQTSWRVSMYNCDNADTNYSLWIETFAGTIRHETTIVRTGGASDGVTPLSWKLSASSSAAYGLFVLKTDEIVVWNDSVGSSTTVTAEVVTDNVTLNDDECWLEVRYMGTSGYPVSSAIDDSKADTMASAAAQSSSSETWTTTGLTTPVKQKLSVTFTPEEKGFIHAVVCLAKASTVVYVDPKLTVT